MMYDINVLISESDVCKKVSSVMKFPQNIIHKISSEENYDNVQSKIYVVAEFLEHLGAHNLVGKVGVCYPLLEFRNSRVLGRKNTYLSRESSPRLIQ